MNIFNIFNRNEKDNNKQVTLEEKWSIDSESYNNPNYKPSIGETQCCNCVYMNKSNILKCPKVGDVSKEILKDEKKCKYREEKNKYLYRNYFLGKVDSKKIWSKSMSIQEIKDLLQIFENEISNCIYEIDENFIMNSRRKILRDNIMDRLNKSEIVLEDILESLFNFWEFIQDEYSGDLIIISKELNKPVQELVNMDKKYRSKGIICEQEKQEIIEIINKLENVIANRI